MGRKNAAIICLLILVAFGAILAYLPGTRTTAVNASVQSVLCSQKVSSKIAANGSQTFDCPVTPNSWFHISLDGTGSFGLTVETSYTSEGNQNYAGSELLYSAVGQNAWAAFPVLQNSNSSQIDIRNFGLTPIVLNGQIEVSTDVPSIVPVTFPIHPYRFFGIAIIAVSLVLIFVAIWSPWSTHKRRELGVPESPASANNILQGKNLPDF